MKTALAVVLLYAIMIVVLTGAWVVSLSFLSCAFLLLGMAQIYITFLPRYHVHLLMKIAEAELKIEQLNTAAEK